MYLYKIPILWFYRENTERIEDSEWVGVSGDREHSPYWTYMSYFSTLKGKNTPTFLGGLRTCMNVLKVCQLRGQGLKIPKQRYTPQRIWICIGLKAKQELKPNSTLLCFRASPGALTPLLSLPKLLLTNVQSGDTAFLLPSGWVWELLPQYFCCLIPSPLCFSTRFTSRLLFIGQ